MQALCCGGGPWAQAWTRPGSHASRRLQLAWLHRPGHSCGAAPADDVGATTTTKSAAAPDTVLAKIAAQQAQAAARPPRFYVPVRLDAATTQQHQQVLLEGEEARHALRSLRLREGDVLELCDGRGTVLPATLAAVDKPAGRAWAQAAGPAVTIPWQGPRWRLAVACTTLKGGRAEWLVEKATELGAAELLPVMTARSQPATVPGGGNNKYKKPRKGRDGSHAGVDDADDPGEGSAGRLQRVAIAATKQSLRAHMLRVRAPAWVEDVAASLAAQRAQAARTGAPQPLALVAVAGAPPAAHLFAQLNNGAPAAAPSLADHADSMHSAPGVVAAAPCTTTLLVGPEGDWTPEELRLLVDQAGALPVGLGSLRLRTETAALALLAAARLLLFTSSSTTTTSAE